MPRPKNMIVEIRWRGRRGSITLVSSKAIRSGERVVGNDDHFLMYGDFNH